MKLRDKFERREQLEDFARLNGMILGDLLGELKNVRSAEGLAEFWNEHGAPSKGKTINNLTTMFGQMPIVRGGGGEFTGRMGGLGIDFEVLKKVLKDISGKVNEVMEPEEAKIQGWEKEGREGYSKARGLQDFRTRMKKAAEGFSKFKKFEEEEVPLPDVPEGVRKEYEGWREDLLNTHYTVGRLPGFDLNPLYEKLCKLLEGEHGKQIHDLILTDLRSCADVKTKRDPDILNTLSYVIGHLEYYKDRTEAMKRLFTDEMAAQLADTRERVVRRGNKWLTDHVSSWLQYALDAYKERQ